MRHYPYLQTVGKDTGIKKTNEEITLVCAVPAYMVSEKANYVTATEVHMRLEAFYNTKTLEMMVLEASINKVMSKMIWKLYRIYFEQKIRHYELKLIPSL